MIPSKVIYTVQAFSLVLLATLIGGHVGSILKNPTHPPSPPTLEATPNITWNDPSPSAFVTKEVLGDTTDPIVSQTHTVSQTVGSVAGISTSVNTLNSLYQAQPGIERAITINDKGLSLDVYNKAKYLYVDLREDGTKFVVRDHETDVFTVDNNKNIIASNGSTLNLKGGLQVNSAAGDPGDLLISQGKGTTPIWGNALDAIGTLPIANGGTNNTSAYTAGSVIFSDGDKLTQDNSNFFWNNERNRLGIGTTVPGDTLDVRGRIRASSDGTNFIEAFAGTSGGLYAAHLGSENNIPLAFYTNSSGPLMTIDTAGNVGIGTASPIHKLFVLDATKTATTVNTNVIASFRSNANGADAAIQFSDNVANASYIGMLGGDLYMSPASSEVLRVTTTGRVGIGTTTPESRLQVTGGGLCVGSDANCNTDNNTEGVVYSSSTSMSVYDLAENYPTKDKTLVATEIVALDPLRGVFVERAKQGSSRLLGIISEKPAVLLGGFNGAQFKDDKQVAVALSGRIPVKANLEGGEIAIGDHLTVSSVPGVAKKAAPGEPSIGYALGEYKGEGDTVMTFAQLESASPTLANASPEPVIDTTALITVLDTRITTLEGTINNALTDTIFTKDLVFLGPITFKGQLNIQSDVIMSKELIVNALTVSNSLTVQGETTLSNQQLGFAKIPEGGTEVKIDFSQPLANTPIINVTPEGVVGNWHIAGRSKTGFTIVLDLPAVSDVIFDWTAFTVKDPYTAQGIGSVSPVSTPSPTPSPSVAPTPSASATPMPSIEPSPTPLPSPTLTPTPIVTPFATPTPEPETPSPTPEI